MGWTLSLAVTGAPRRRGTGDGSTCRRNGGTRERMQRKGCSPFLAKLEPFVAPQVRRQWLGAVPRAQLAAQCKHANHSETESQRCLKRKCDLNFSEWNDTAS